MRNAPGEAGCGLRGAGCGVETHPTVGFPPCLAVCSVALPSIVVFAFSLVNSRWFLEVGRLNVTRSRVAAGAAALGKFQVFW